MQESMRGDAIPFSSLVQQNILQTDLCIYLRDLEISSILLLTASFC